MRSRFCSADQIQIAKTHKNNFRRPIWSAGSGVRRQSVHEDIELGGQVEQSQATASSISDQESTTFAAKNYLEIPTVSKRRAKREATESKVVPSVAAENRRKDAKTSQQGKKKRKVRQSQETKARKAESGIVNDKRPSKEKETSSQPNVESISLGSKRLKSIRRKRSSANHRAFSSNGSSRKSLALPPLPTLSSTQPFSLPTFPANISSSPSLLDHLDSPVQHKTDYSYLSVPVLHHHLAQHHQGRGHPDQHPVSSPSAQFYPTSLSPSYF